MPQTPYEVRKADEIEAAARRRDLTLDELTEYQRLARVSYLRKIEQDAEYKRQADAFGMPFARAAVDLGLCVH